MYPPDCPPGKISEFIDRTERLYAQMDRAYRRAAEASGFVCSGCEDNCCRTLFYHHTFAEYFTLYRGFSALPRPQRDNIRSRAAACLRTAAGDRPRRRELCPLNDSGRCVLYGQRPMICRLHGVPHEFTPPGGESRVGPGCEPFYRRCGHLDHPRLDRTPHYLHLARLESGLRQVVGVNRKIKLTLAQMLITEPSEYIGRMQALPGILPVTTDPADETN